MCTSAFKLYVLGQLVVLTSRQLQMPVLASAVVKATNGAAAVCCEGFRLHPAVFNADYLSYKGCCTAPAVVKPQLLKIQITTAAVGACSDQAAVGLQQDAPRVPG